MTKRHGMLYQSPPMICRRQAHAMHAMVDWVQSLGWEFRLAPIVLHMAVAVAPTAERAGQIIVRITDPPEEQVFSLAHELAHLITGIREEDAATAVLGILRASTTDRERECDNVAREILLAIS